MKPGMYPDLSNEEYHSHKESISRSGIMDFDKSPFLYWANHLNAMRPVREQTPQMLFGEAFHTMIIEPQLFHEKFIVKPSIEKLPKVGLLRDLGRPEYDKQKAARDKQSLINKSIEEDFEAQADNKKILTAEEMNRLFDMKMRLFNHDRAMKLIAGAKYEQSYFWEDPTSGLLVKCRPDILHDNLIVDLKTCRDASPRAFQSAIADGGYHIQGAMIADGVEAIEGRRITNVINIAIETQYPYNIGIYIIDESALEAGKDKYVGTLMRMKEAREQNVYEDYGVHTIGLPRWAL